MKLRLKKLWGEPPLYDPIPFEPGVNLILGERSDEGEQKNKLNSVGKSLSIEFLHFALLRQFTSTRVSKIPDDIFPDEFVVILDLAIDLDDVQIRRSIASPDTPTIIVNGASESFSTLNDAQSRLDQLIFSDHADYGDVSGRVILSLLMRDEGSGFQDVERPHSSKRSVPPDIRPHLFLMGIPANTVNNLNDSIKSLKLANDRKTASKKLLEANGSRTIEEVPMQLNAGEKATHEIEAAIKQLRAEPAFADVEEELVGLEQSLRDLRAERKILSTKIRQIESIPLPEQISADDLRLVYDRIQKGLGDLVQRSFDQAQDFKTKVDQFQRGLQKEELTNLERERKALTNQISTLSSQHAGLVERIDNQETLSELEIGLELAQQRADEYYTLKANYATYEKAVDDAENAKDDRSRDLIQVKNTLRESEAIIEALEKILLKLHQKIMQSALASFALKVTDSVASKNPVSIDLRIDGDGGQSVNKARVFMYDLALLMNGASKVHPGFLLHDNILEVDQDTTVLCLNYLAELQQDEEVDFQYVLTLNRDKIEGEESERINLDINEVRRAMFTKQNRFLKTQYQEIGDK